MKNLFIPSARLIRASLIVGVIGTVGVLAQDQPVKEVPLEPKPAEATRRQEARDFPVAELQNIRLDVSGGGATLAFSVGANLYEYFISPETGLPTAIALVAELRRADRIAVRGTPPEKEGESFGISRFSFQYATPKQ